jgi:alpha-tubulin suppressor-like RCC1 family protein
LHEADEVSRSNIQHNRDNYDGQCNVGGWTGIDQVAAGWYHTVGLKSDGTVVAAGAEIELAKWNLIEAVP